MEIQARSVAGVLLQERMTPQKDLVELAEKCLELTEVVNASMNWLAWDWVWLGIGIGIGIGLECDQLNPQQNNQPKCILFDSIPFHLL